MCQLTLATTGNKELNELLAISAIFGNTIENHKDGFGISIPEQNFSYRWDKWPWWAINFRTYISKKFDDNYFITHVRKASFVSQKENIEFNQPFESKELIFAHNGTLSLNKGLIPLAELDSKHFFNALNLDYLETRNVPQSLKNTMKLYHGTFAFIVYEKKTFDYYIALGTSKTLFYRKIAEEPTGKNIGFIINTEEASIAHILVMWSNLAGITYNWTEKTEKLGANSIYKLNKFYDPATEFPLVKVDEIIENYPPVKAYDTVRYDSSFDTAPRGRYATDRSFKIIQELVDFQNTWMISPAYFDEIVFQIFGKSLLYLNDAELGDCRNFISFLESQLSMKKKFLQKMWELARNHKGFSEFAFHKKYDIIFPYMLETDKKKIRESISNLIQQEVDE